MTGHRRRERERYIAHVVTTLAGEFDWDETTTYICRAQLEHAEYTNGFPPWFEFICDEPVVANWRLKSEPTDRKRVRMCYYGGPLNKRSQVRADDLTHRLNAEVQ